MFPVWHIALTALVTAVLTAAGTAAWRGRGHGVALATSRATGCSWRTCSDLVGVGVASGLGVFLWRLGANIPTLNNDPVPGVSPADVLSAPLAYVATGIFVRLRTVDTPGRLAVAPAIAALVALLVNVVTI